MSDVSPLLPEPLAVAPAPEKGGSVPRWARQVVAAWWEVLQAMSVGTPVEPSRVCIFGSVLSGDYGIRGEDKVEKEIDRLIRFEMDPEDLGMPEDEAVEVVRSAYQNCRGRETPEAAARCIEASVPRRLEAVAVEVVISDIDGYAVLEVTSGSEDEAINEFAKEMYETYTLHPEGSLPAEINNRLAELSYPFHPGFSMEYEWSMESAAEFADHLLCWTESDFT